MKSNGNFPKTIGRNQVSIFAQLLYANWFGFGFVIIFGRKIVTKAA